MNDDESTKGAALYVRRLNVSLTAEEDEMLLELLRRMQGDRPLATLSDVVRAALRAAATGGES